MRRAALHAGILAAIALAATVAIAGSMQGPPRWTPDALFYQARVYELHGAGEEEALRRAFQGPLAADLRRVDPHHSGDFGWVAYNARFYERRLIVPLMAAAVEPLSGDRALLDVSLAGHVVAVLALFWLLSLRFRTGIAAGVALAAAFLPALVEHASYPLTDSWGLALQTLALGCAVRVVGGRTAWLVPWAAAIALLSFTRDSTWIPVAAAAWLTVNQRSRVSVRLFASGLAAALPAFVAIHVPMRELLAQMLNGIEPAPGTPWSEIAGAYPGAIVDLLRADGGFVRDEAWLSALFLLGGLALLFALARGRDAGQVATLMKGAVLAGAAYVLAVPVFTAFRLELVLVPMAAFGIALGAERALARAAAVAPLAARPARSHD